MNWFRDRVRAWLLGEEIKELRSICFIALPNLQRIAEQAINQNSRLLGGQATMQTDLAKLVEAVERLNLLLAPELPRIRAGRPRTVPEWDQVQRENMKQFEESEIHGKSLHK